MSLDADYAGLANHGSSVPSFGGDDEITLVLDNVVALIPGADVGVTVMPRIRHRVQLEAARNPRLVLRYPQFGGVPLSLFQNRLLVRGQFLNLNE